MNIKSLTTGLALLLLAPMLAYAAPTLETSRFTDLNAHPTTIAALRGRVVLVNFWAPWCGPCREEMPMLDRLRQQVKGKGIEVIGIALDNKPEVQAYLRKNPVHYPIWLGDDQSMDLLPALGNAAIGLPFTVLLDRQGRQVARWTGQLSKPVLERALAPYR
jgi:thiol-disulfide isomerase/thioredoxin